MVGAVLSASLVGGIFGALGAMLAARAPSLHLTTWGFLASVAMIYGFAELQGAKWPVLTRHWQIPKKWGWYGLPLFAIAFGLILGSGLFTFITFIGYHLLLLLCVIRADPLQGSVLMAFYGAARAAPVLFAPLVFWLRKRTYTYETATEVNAWFDRLDRPMRWLRAVVLLTIAGSAIAATLGRL